MELKKFAEKRPGSELEVLAEGAKVSQMHFLTSTFSVFHKPYRSLYGKSSSFYHLPAKI